MADIGMHRIGEIDRRRAGRQFDDAAFRRKDVNFVREEIGFHALDKFKRTARALLQLQQALQPALGANLRGSAAFARLFISPVRGDPHFRHLIHIFGTDLHLDRHAVRTDHRGMQRLIAVGFGDSDVIFHTAWTRFVQAVHLTEHAIAGVHVLHDHAESVDIHDGVKALLFQRHFAVDRVEMFFTAADAAGNARFLQTPVDFRQDLLNHLFAVAARRFDDLFNHAIAIRVERLEAQLFQLDLQVMDTQAMRQRTVDLQSFQRDATTLVWTQRAQRTHIVRAVGQLDENDADILHHRHDHLAEVLSLRLFLVAEGQLIQLGYAFH